MSFKFGLSNGNSDVDPWAERNNGNIDNNSNDASTKISPISDSLGNSLATTINIFGDSNASSMMDSIVGSVDPIGYIPNNNWGDYNSFNILSSNNSSNQKSAKSDSTLDKIANLTIKQKGQNVLSHSNTQDNYSQYNNNRYSNENDNEEDEEDEQEDYENENSTNPLEVRIWSDEEVRHFNPLSLKNSKDGLVVKVREIPEKEGLVFKHINYLICHSLSFSNELNTVKSKTNEEDTKVIRRYSDFAWLVEALWKKYPFRLIPELPPKKFALASSNDVLFLQKRRRGLERFLYQLCKHPVLSKENLVTMFLTVPNDFNNWKKFANIELNDEFDGIRVNLPRRFKIDLSEVLKGLRDDNSEYDDNDEEEATEEEQYETHNSNNKFKSRDEFVNNVNQIWNESPTRYKDKEFIVRVNGLNDSLSKLAETWSKLYLLVERIEKREIALAADHQRFSMCLDKLIKFDDKIFGMDNLIENKSRQVDEDTNNTSIINSILYQVCKYFIGTRKLKEEEMLIINNEVLESWKKFHDYLISLHFLIERLFIFKTESEKEMHILLQRIIKTNERILLLKRKSDIRGSEVDKHISTLTTSMDQLSMLISRIILVKTTFVNEFKLFQKTKYMISEVFQNWFDQRSKYFEMQNDSIQRLFNDLKDLPLGN